MEVVLDDAAGFKPVELCSLGRNFDTAIERGSAVGRGALRPSGERSHRIRFWRVADHRGAEEVSQMGVKATNRAASGGLGADEQPCDA